MSDDIVRRLAVGAYKCDDDCSCFEAGVRAGLGYAFGYAADRVADAANPEDAEMLDVIKQLRALAEKGEQK